MDWAHPEDKDRKFVFSYSLSDCCITIIEIPQRNSGFVGGTYLKATRIPKPGTSLDNPEYYTPLDLYIGKFSALIQWMDWTMYWLTMLRPQTHITPWDMMVLNTHSWGLRFNL